jgi:hypothetical protein
MMMARSCYGKSYFVERNYRFVIFFWVGLKQRIELPFETAMPLYFLDELMLLIGMTLAGKVVISVGVPYHRVCLECSFEQKRAS